ncbi:hypothetical protein [Spirulina sp. 06S082]|uniref:hypothetical protein n=1 Tax=Spirulina sp. 06S082 TaxID=3110248 RepID=UPI002B20A37F|nr:hypothetical protein [Spirulina sp. 06S082]MEA5470752.1 hypothetical protein [Spirulina sp. 06S082]
MMNLKAIDTKFLMAIKVLSTLLIAGAIALELWTLYQQEIPHFLTPILYFVTFALVSHFIEGMIGAFVAFRQQKNAIAAGVYIFFTGTVGLLEVLE